MHAETPGHACAVLPNGPGSWRRSLAPCAVVARLPTMPGYEHVLSRQATNKFAQLTSYLYTLVSCLLCSSSSLCINGHRPNGIQQGQRFLHAARACLAWAGEGCSLVLHHDAGIKQTSI